MPIYEYRCRDCEAKLTVLVGMTSDGTEVKCERCGGKNLNRLVSRFRVGRDEDARIDEMADRVERMGEPESPAQLREVMREMGKAMDEDYSDEMEKVFEEDVASPSPEP